MSIVTEDCEFVSSDEEDGDDDNNTNLSGQKIENSKAVKDSALDFKTESKDGAFASLLGTQESTKKEDTFAKQLRHPLSGGKGVP